MSDSKSGIYKITINQKHYIGSAKDIKGRIYRHLRDLKSGSHCNIKLQRAFNKYGAESFTYEILEYTEIQLLIPREQYYIDELKPFYNICRIAGNSTGFKHSAETREYLSKIKKGKQNSLGRKMSDETKRKIGEKAKERGIPRACVEASKKANTGTKRSREIVETVALKQSKFNCEDVNRIFNLAAEGRKQIDIAKIFNVSQAAISRVVTGKCIYKNYQRIEENKAQIRMVI